VRPRTHIQFPRRGFFDSLLAALRARLRGAAPQRALPTLRGRYDAAQTTHENRRHWANADHLSARAAASPEVRRTLRSRARYEVANNSYAKGIVLTLANYVVGTGPRLQMLSDDPEANRLVEKEFARWAAGVGLAHKLRTMRVAQCESGECFGLLATNPRVDAPVQLDLRLIEADQVASPVWSPESAVWRRSNRTHAPGFEPSGLQTTASSLLDGVLYDDFGNPVAYTILRRHPGDASALLIDGLDFDVLPVESVIHLFRSERPGQSRGVPEITPALPLFAMLRRYTLAVLGAAEQAALPSGVIYTDAPADAEASNVEPMDTVEMDRGTWLTMPYGWKINQVRAEQPTTVYAEFKHEVSRRGATAIPTGSRCGSGKTTALELIRFALDAIPSNDADPYARRRLEALIAENLGGGRVELTVATREGLTYVVTRSVGEEPIVLDADRQPTAVSLRAGRLFGADIFSQNEIERIADHGPAQLALLDRFEAEELVAVGTEIRAVQNALDANAGQIVPLQNRIDGLAEELAALPALEEQLRGLAAAATSAASAAPATTAPEDPAPTGEPAATVGESSRGSNESAACPTPRAPAAPTPAAIPAPTPAAINEAHTLKALRDREQRTLDALTRSLSDLDGQIDGLRGFLAVRTTSAFGPHVGSGPNAAAITEVKRMALDCSSHVDAALTTAREAIHATQSRLARAAQHFQLRHSEQELAFRALIEQHAAAQAQATERTRLERQRNQLLVHQGTHGELLTQRDRLTAERDHLLQQLAAHRDRRFAIRRRIAESINEQLAGRIRVTIHQSGDARQYADLLSAALRSARVKVSSVVPKLVQAFWPDRLAALVRSGDPRPMIDDAELSPDQARKILDGLAVPEVLFRLESVDLGDAPRIELNDNGEYKPSGSLSTGQKCTAVLPILLLDSANPLLIDQPEDNLDNRFIFEHVVGSLREVKTRRQLLFVTHNPNIPVLGDAERVFVLDSDGLRAFVACAGSVDDCREPILTLLEGGAEAFTQRQCRYGCTHASAA